MLDALRKFVLKPTRPKTDAEAIFDLAQQGERDKRVREQAEAEDAAEAEWESQRHAVRQLHGEVVHDMARHPELKRQWLEMAETFGQLTRELHARQREISLTNADISMLNTHLGDHQVKDLPPYPPYEAVDLAVELRRRGIP
jgi:hypothetical protein